MFLPLSYWVEDYPAEKLRRPAGMNFVAFLTSEPIRLLSRGPGNICVARCNLHRDQPYLRDLYPAESAFLGKPLLPAQARRSNEATQMRRTQRLASEPADAQLVSETAQARRSAHAKDPS